MSENPVLVLGGTGKTGKRVVAQLTRGGHAVRVASRGSPTRFDWHDQGSWELAVTGAAALYLVPDDADDGEALRALVDLAVSHKVARLVLLSAREWEELGVDAGLVKERTVQNSGVDWTILRPTWFAQNFSEEPFLWDDVLRGEILLPAGAGVHPFIDVADIAAVAAAALTEPGHAGKTYALSGPRALDLAEIARNIADATGRTIRYAPATTDEYVEHLVQGGKYSRAAAAGVAWLADHIRLGRDAHLSDGVQHALGREPRDFSAYVRETVTSGAWDSHPTTASLGATNVGRQP